MWVFTDSGYISAVAHWDDPDILVVRARDKASLLAVVESIYASDHQTSVSADEIFTGAGTDYKWRIFISRTDFATFLANQAFKIDYTSFKDQVTLTRGDEWHDALMNVWVSMLRVEDSPMYELEGEDNASTALWYDRALFS